LLKNSHCLAQAGCAGLLVGEGGALDCGYVHGIGVHDGINLFPANEGSSSCF
jgi:hypothetical protein